MPVSEGFLNISSRIPREGAPRQGPLHGASSERERERCPIPRAPFVQLWKSLLDEPSSRFPYEKRGTSPEPFSIYPSGSPTRETSLQVPFTELPQRETLHLQSPFQPYLKVLGR
jgi:hypothetical protein